LTLDGLELKPYQYKEMPYSDKRLEIHARFILSKDEYSNIGKLPRVIKVIRTGFDDEPNEMQFIEIAWSEFGDKIKEEIHFSEKELGNRLPLVTLANLYSLATEQKILLDEVLNLLVSNGVIRNEMLNELKTKIDDNIVEEKKRELRHLKKDLDEYDFK
jgi:hypothetical protein